MSNQPAIRRSKQPPHVSRVGGPFKVHEVWNEQRRSFDYCIRHGRTPQVRTIYPLQARATCEAWNRMAAQ